MLQVDIGDNDVDQSDMVPVTVHPGESVTVSNITGSSATLNYFSAIDGPATTITVGNAATFSTGSVWLQSQGRSTVQVTGGMYG